MNIGWLCHISALIIFSVAVSYGRFMHHETEAVPLARLLTNLQQRLATNDQNVEVLYQLARVHSIAYASRATTVPVAKKDSQPVFGNPGQDAGVPLQVLSASERQLAQRRQHLTNAISYYGKANALLGDESGAAANQWLTMPINLGHAWCLDQAGRRRDAVASYRVALQHAWKAEVDNAFALREGAEWSWDRLRAGRNILLKPQHGHLGPGICYSEEIIGYLRALLDPIEDAKEIAQLETDRKALERMPRAITPLLMPLRISASLNELVDPGARVPFDLDGSGKQRAWGWITTNAAWLVFDPSGDGRITSALQMFGNVTFWIFWRDGYQALSSLDENQDGELTGDELRGVALWNDRNSDGISDPGEVSVVAACGIVSINCRSDQHVTGIPFSERGVSFCDGTKGPTYDWIAPSR